jgi:carbonic anhydrase
MIRVKSSPIPMRSTLALVDLARQAVPPGVAVSGLVYDVDTGLIEVVVPA